MTELTSPDGKLTIKCHPSKVEQMKKDGWTETKSNQKKATK